MMMIRLRNSAMLIAFGGALLAGGERLSAQGSEAAVCARLEGLSIPATSIALPTRGARITAVHADRLADGRATYSYCLLRGEIDAIDRTAQPIRFELAMPSNWNGKLLQFGGGGWDGKIPDVKGTATRVFRGDPPLAHGYTVFASDSGHASAPGINEAAFALNAEQLENFASAQIKKTHDVAQFLVSRHYGRDASRTYFIGGSEGGRESMAAIQRFPGDYEGVITLYPAFNWVSTFLKFQMIGTQMRSGDGEGWVSPAKLATLKQAELARCDDQDGVRDGIVGLARQCAFDPAAITCPSGRDEGDHCLSGPQLETVSMLRATQRLPYSFAHRFPGSGQYYAGTDFSTYLGNTKTFDQPPRFWLPDAKRTDIANPGVMHMFGDSFVRFAILQNPSANTLGFDPRRPGKFEKRVEYLSNLLDMTSTDVEAFVRHGGKWILMHGLSDGLPAAADTEAYFTSLVRHYGARKTDAFVRFYTIPGFGHGEGSFNARVNILDALEALDAWVEGGIVPGVLVAQDIQHARTRPICRYPAYPRYRGSGDPDLAASFDCSDPR